MVKLRQPKTDRRYGIPPGYIGVADMQELLNKGRTSIWRMIKDGRLPEPLYDGRLCIWNEKVIKRWIENEKFIKK